MKQAPLGIYLHIPFCVRKCLYCDFLSAPADEQTKTEYVEALLAEIRAQAPLYSDYVVKTVFFGGGTPSLLPGKELFRIMECLICPGGRSTGNHYGSQSGNAYGR